MKQEFKNILIVRTDRIGDVVLTTPAIQALREAYPAAKISILVNPVTKDLVTGNSYLDEVFIDDREREHKGKGFLKLVSTLRKKKFDLAIIFHTKRRANLLCFLAGIPRRVGYKNNKLGFLLTHPIEDKRHLGEKHEAQYCLDVLRHLGVETNHFEISIPIQRKAEQWLKEFEQNNQIKASDQMIAVHAGASDPSKRWPEARFAEMIDILMKCYPVKVVLIGGADIKEISEKILSLVSRPILDLTGKTSVGELAALLKRCALLISNDSGPVHVAAGVGTPVVSIFTRNHLGINPERWRPLGEKCRVVSVMAAPWGLSADEPPTSHKFQPIPVQEVFEAVDAIFKLC